MIILAFHYVLPLSFGQSHLSQLYPSSIDQLQELPKLGIKLWFIVKRHLSFSLCNCPCSKKQGPMLVAFPLGCCDHNTLCVNCDHNKLIERDLDWVCSLGWVQSNVVSIWSFDVHLKISIRHVQIYIWHKIHMWIIKSTFHHNDDAILSFSTYK